MERRQTHFPWGCLSTFIEAVSVLFLNPPAFCPHTYICPWTLKFSKATAFCLFPLLSLLVDRWVLIQWCRLNKLCSCSEAHSQARWGRKEACCRARWPTWRRPRATSDSLTGAGDAGGGGDGGGAEEGPEAEGILTTTPLLLLELSPTPLLT